MSKKPDSRDAIVAHYPVLMGYVMAVYEISKEDVARCEVLKGCDLLEAYNNEHMTNPSGFCETQLHITNLRALYREPSTEAPLLDLHQQAKKPRSGTKKKATKE